jgi:ureidoglycolate lyase
VSSLLRLTPESFAVYGYVGRAGDGVVKTIRNGGAVLTKSPVSFEHDVEAVDHALEFYQVKAEGTTLHAMQAERHPHSAQMFIPVSVESYLVVVWNNHPNGGGLPAAFVAGPEDVVVYKPGIWHHGIVALGRDGLFASTMWKTRGGTDVEFLPLEQKATFDLSGAQDIL